MVYAAFFDAGRTCVTTKATDGEVQDDKQHDQNQTDDPKYFHPAWCACDRYRPGPNAGIAAYVWVGWRVSHVRDLLYRARLSMVS